MAEVIPSRSGAIPTRNPAFGGQRRYVRSIPLVNNVVSLSSPFIVTSVNFRARIPSNRLHAIAFITYAPDTTEDVAFPTDVTDPAAWIITMDAWTRLENGKPTRANNIFGTRVAALPVPNSWESVTGVFEWRGTVTVPQIAGDGGGTGIAAGTLWLTVYWEPAAGESNMPQEELEALFASCMVEGQTITTATAIIG